ncbi:hypothetical protein [Arthrobacter sp. U41]|uniref:hypothetical protein n=1 Tax=Arthrobacter sp. U41 TaxID=1849032 RepID=UPI0022B23DE8|nr:hypothetical protein [Arthrobacter sp. U41]
MHSDSLQCLSGASDVASNADGTLADSSCTIREYGNTMDLMGVSQLSQPTISSSLWQYGGFGRGDEILDAGKITDSRSFTLTAWAGTAPNRAVKFTDPISGEAYYLELRLPVGYDAATAVGGNRGVNIVQSGGRSAASSIILMPSTKPYSGYYGQNHAWQAGQAFTTHAGTRVSIGWISDTAAGVTIESTAAIASRAMAPVASATTGLGSPTSGVVCGLRNGGCYQDYQGGAIIWSPATGAQPTMGAIRARWGALNFVDGPMGYPTSGEFCGLPQGGCYQDYQGGAIIWSPTTGAHASTGPTRTAWARTGFLDGPLAYPTSDIVCGLVNGGCYQDYQGGAIIWSPTTGAHPSTGPTRTAWAKTGFLTGALGYPTSDLNCGLVNGGCYQDYQGGAIIWSPTTGAHPSTGPTRTAWAKTGFLTGPLAYPTSDIVCGLVNGGCYQDYQGGAIIWSPTTGAHPSTGPTRTAWAKTGFLTGPLAYPTSDIVCGLVNGGCYQDYQGGAIIWSPTTGAHPSTGPTRTAWAKTGFLTGPLAYPTSDIVCGLVNGGCYQDYQGGAIIWSPTTGAHPSTGPIRTRWAALNFVDGPLGYPTGDVTCGQPGGGCYQDYQGGAIIWSPTTGAQPSLKGPIRDFWAATGFLTGPLGYPTTAQTCNPSGDLCTQQFAGGRISWTAARGAYID